jgi:virulence-associated protein VapD
MEKRKQITFDVDTRVARMILGKSSYTKIYMDIQKFMEDHEWQHIQGSVYISRKPLNYTDVSYLLYRLLEQYPYITKCIRDICQTDVPERIYSMNWQFDYDGTPGRFAKPEPEHKMQPKHRSR